MLFDAVEFSTKKVVIRRGLEPRTPALKGRCSTD